MHTNSRQTRTSWSYCSLYFRFDEVINLFSHLRTWQSLYQTELTNLSDRFGDYCWLISSTDRNQCLQTHQSHNIYPLFKWDVLLFVLHIDRRGQHLLEQFGNWLPQLECRDSMRLMGNMRLVTLKGGCSWRNIQPTHNNTHTDTRWVHI